MTRLAVAELSPRRWQEAWERSAAPLPFGHADWVGLRQPDRSFRPALAIRPDGPDLLVPLCVTRSGTGVIGAYGYGFVQPVEGPCTGLPGYAALARALCDELDLDEVRTVLPPLGLCPELDAATAHWAAEPGEVSHIVRLDDGLPGAWSRIDKKHRRTIRRAEQHGVQVVAGTPQHLPALLDLYERTMERIGLICVYEPEDLAFLFAPDRDDVVVGVAQDGAEVLAVRVMAVAAGAAYSLIATVSDRGRALGAGHLAFWSMAAALSRAGIRAIDLGPTTNPGQESFKRHLGSTTAPTLAVCWPGT